MSDDSTKIIDGPAITKEFAKGLAEGAAISAVAAVGFTAILLGVGKVREIRENRKNKKSLTPTS